MAKNIYVGNLPFSVTEADFRAMFEEYGAVSSANLIMDRDTGRPRGFGFVEMDDDSQAQAAMEALDGADLDGRALKVNEAKPRERRPSRGRSW